MYLFKLSCEKCLTDIAYVAAGSEVVADELREVLPYVRVYCPFCVVPLMPTTIRVAKEESTDEKHAPSANHE